MIRFFANEVFKEISIEGKLQLRYAISNMGRLVSFIEKPEEGRIVNGSTIDGYRIFRYKVRNSENIIKHKHFFYYKLVAEYFLEKKSADQVYVLHLDRDRANDVWHNLQWATRTEMLEHQRNSPYVKEAIENRLKKNKIKGAKLTIAQVIYLKRKLLDPNRKTRLKIYAKQYGVSEMTLQRIRTGENWGHVKV